MKKKKQTVFITLIVINLQIKMTIKIAPSTNIDNVKNKYFHHCFNDSLMMDSLLSHLHN